MIPVVTLFVLGAETVVLTLLKIASKIIVTSSMFLCA